MQPKWPSLEHKYIYIYVYGGLTLALATLSSIGLGTLPQGGPNQRKVSFANGSCNPTEKSSVVLLPSLLGSFATLLHEPLRHYANKDINVDS